MVCAPDIHDESGDPGTKLVHALALAFVALALAAPVWAEPQDAGNATPRRRPLPSPPEPPPAVEPGPPVENTEEPTGYTGPPAPPETFPAEEEVDSRNRWRVGLPFYNRQPDNIHEAPLVRGQWWDPYDQNVLKGDYPVFGTQNTFFAFTLRSDTLLEGRRLPTPSDVSSARPGSYQFFGNGSSLLFNQNFPLTVELFEGNAGFRPRQWELRATPVFNVNYLSAREQGVVNINPAHGTTRLDGHVAMQELFGDYELATVGPYFDTINVRGGIQGFSSDFRGFLFVDHPAGLKLSGTYGANRTQWNVAYFRPLDKDTNTGLNSFHDRDQNVAIGTLTRQDFLFPGYFAELIGAFDRDNASKRFDSNGFLVRPAAIGDAAPHQITVGYLGWTGDGHIDRIGVSHAFFQAIGRDDRNPIAGRATDVNAQMAALEVSYDRDWLRPKASFFWSSGDGKPTDGTARGFDSILDDPLFVGGPTSFWDRQGIKLTGTNVNLTNRFSLLPNLRPSNIQGQQNFVNPGIFIFNVGLFGRLTPKLAFEANVNYLRFQEPAPLKLVLLQHQIGHSVGIDYSIAFTYRPLLIDNIILVAGLAGLTPLDGFRDIYTAQTLFQGFLNVILTY